MFKGDGSIKHLLACGLVPLEVNHIALKPSKKKRL